jgi:uncharacterized membrane protein
VTEPRQVHTAVEHLVARVLLVGGLAGLVLIAVGLGAYAAQGGFHHQVLVLKREPGAPPPGVFSSLRQVVQGVRRRPIDPLAVSAIGLVVLMLTPGVAVAVALPCFVAAREYRHATIVAAVLSMLLLSLLLAGAVH